MLSVYLTVLKVTQRVFFVHLKGEFRDYAEVTKGTCCQKQALKSKLELAEQFQFLPIYR